MPLIHRLVNYLGMVARTANVVEIRSRDADRTRQEILAAATAEFAAHGFGGARIEAIADRAGVNKKLIYYYFEGKDELFLAVLEQTYADIRAAERELHLEAAVMTFEPHPRRIFRPDEPMFCLTPPAMKQLLLERAGLSGLITLTFDRAFASTSALSPVSADFPFCSTSPPTGLYPNGYSAWFRTS